MLLLLLLLMLLLMLLWLLRTQQQQLQQQHQVLNQLPQHLLTMQHQLLVPQLLPPLLPHQMAAP
jgi:hypothetical protein